MGPEHITYFNDKTIDVSIAQKTIKGLFNCIQLFIFYYYTSLKLCLFCDIRKNWRGTVE